MIRNDFMPSSVRAGEVEPPKDKDVMKGDIHLKGLKNAEQAMSMRIKKNLSGVLPSVP